MPDTATLGATPPAAGQEALVTLSRPESPQAEAFRQLRATLPFMDPERPVRVLLATSTRDDEGKTATLANLAVALAQTGRSVALVDCDMRRPGLHLLFGLDNATGLSTLLQEGVPPGLPLRETGVPQLRVLPSGPQPPDSAVLLAAPAMAEVLRQLRNQADYVLLDAPPLVAVGDAAVLAPQVDGLLLVLKAGVTQREAAQRAKALLQRVNVTILGVVLNNVQPHRDAWRYFASQGRPVR
ncbi:MAG: CpsD/CapB family tyrosine-protein kinase [Chloroflexi bacterium]|nr:CpsD/CapB family tyrosine-protein kinase [Chloroflexota bacterium]